MTEIETRVHWATNPSAPEYHFTTLGTVYLTRTPKIGLKLESILRLPFALPTTRMSLR